MYLTWLFVFVCFINANIFAFAQRYRHLKTLKRFRYLIENDEKLIDDSKQRHSKIWAVLVAGSNHWYNYRHQADVCHAYHVLRNHGIPQERIVTMLYDDIANSKSNPYPGKIYNHPEGDNVYKGVRIDYSGSAVTPENFLAILEGNKTAVNGGNGRVLNSSENDHVFIYFSDHGAVGLVSFPNGVLTVKDLSDILRKMQKRKLFNKLVFYLEACESGSMFNGILNKTANIYAVTAANEHESSWGCFCENDLKLPCMGDEFSVNWMDDSDEEDLRLETLGKQFTLVRNETSKSHVMNYGDMKMIREFVADFQGWRKAPKRKSSTDFKRKYPSSKWNARDVYLLHLKKLRSNTADPVHYKRLTAKIKRSEMNRKYLDNFIISAVESIVHDEDKERWILNNHPHQVTRLQCHDDVVKWFNKHCFHFSRNPYALKYVYVLANLCEMGYTKSTIATALSDSCLDIKVHYIK